MRNTQITRRILLNRNTFLLTYPGHLHYPCKHYIYFYGLRRWNCHWMVGHNFYTSEIHLWQWIRHTLKLAPLHRYLCYEPLVGYSWKRFLFHQINTSIPYQPDHSVQLGTLSPLWCSNMLHIEVIPIIGRWFSFLMRASTTIFYNKSSFGGSKWSELASNSLDRTFLKSCNITDDSACWEDHMTRLVYLYWQASARKMFPSSKYL